MQRLMHPVYLPPGTVPNVVNSHIVYLNPCTGGCTVHQVAQGASDSRTDSSDIGAGTLSAFSGGTSSTKWKQIMSCVQGVMSPFNITVTDVDPGSVDHFEIMVAGSACQILQGTIGSQCQFVGGIADFAFSGYIPNALVFDFTESWNGYPDPVTQDCATIAQEVAHAWGLDHTINHTDPMTYNALQKPLAYQNNATCGSDCQLNGSSCQDPYNGATCTGACGQTGSSNATHPCLAGTGSSTQNEVDLLMALFGPAGAQAPTITITSPAAGAAVQSGFEIDVNCTSGDGIQEIDFSFDGTQKATLTSSPAKFTAPTGLKDGAHSFSILCASNKQATATAMENVIVGEKCSTDADCMMNFICYQQACIAGPNATGGLGDPCTKNTDCQSNTCASDGTTSACVVPCATDNDQCPSGTGCLSTGNTGTAGVCFPGAAHGDAGGCCETGRGSSPAGPMLLSGLIAALWITRRNKPKS
jgi:hypothetical protein